MNLLRVAIVALMLQPAAHAQGPGAVRMTVEPALVVKPVMQLQPVVRPEPIMVIAPPVATKPPVLVKAPGTPAYRAELPAVQRPGEPGKSGAPHLTPLDDANAQQTGSAADKDYVKMDDVRLQEVEQQQSRMYNTLSNASKKRHDAAQKAIENMR